jgi:hypothetical protein
VGQFAPIQLYGDLLDALQGEYKVGDETSALAWTLLSTSGSAAPFESNWGSVRLVGTTPTAATGSAQVTVSGDSTFDTGSFTVTNTGLVDITRLVFTIDDTFVDDIFWATDGSGDNETPKPFTVDSAGGTGVTNSNGVTVNPLPGGGYSGRDDDLQHRCRPKKRGGIWRWQSLGRRPRDGRDSRHRILRRSDLCYCQAGRNWREYVDGERLCWSRARD